MSRYGTLAATAPQTSGSRPECQQCSRIWRPGEHASQVVNSLEPPCRFLCVYTPGFVQCVHAARSAVRLMASNKQGYGNLPSMPRRLMSCPELHGYSARQDCKPVFSFACNSDRCLWAAVGFLDSTARFLVCFAEKACGCISRLCNDTLKCLVQTSAPCTGQAGFALSLLKNAS